MSTPKTSRPAIMSATPTATTPGGTKPTILDDPKVRASVAAVVATFPPLTAEQRAQLRSLLAPALRATGRRVA